MFWIKTSIEIFILFLAFYYVIRFLQGTQAEGIIKGYFFVFVLTFMGLLATARYFELTNLAHLLYNFLGIYLFAIVVIFQSELRYGLVQLGQMLFGKILKTDSTASEKEILHAVLSLARNKTGALIAIEKDIELGDYLKKQCTLLDAVLSAELLQSIFWHNAPLHDGAVIIRDGRIAAARCFFPLSEKALPVHLGTRHRSALGVSEVTDAFVIVVSEERGEISVCEKGRLDLKITLEQLEKRLKQTVLQTTLIAPKKFNPPKSKETRKFKAPNSEGANE